MSERKRVVILQEDEEGIITEDGQYYLWNEIEIDADDPTGAFVLPRPEPKLIKFKCKPTYNFQSVEFEIECSENFIDPMFSLYKKVLEGLIAITPDQPKNGVVPKPASEKQIEIMEKFKIPYKTGISYEEADAKIQESMKRAREKSRAY